MPLVRFGRSTLLVVMALGLFSCTPPPIQFSLSTKDGKTHVAMVQDWGLIFSDEKPPCVERIDLWPIEETSKFKYADRVSIWSIAVPRASSEGCRDLEGLTIGETPKGFEEVISYEPVSGDYVLHLDGTAARGELEIEID